MFENQTFDPRRKRVPGDYGIYLIFLEEDEGWEEVKGDLDLDDPVDDLVPGSTSDILRIIKSRSVPT